MDNVNDKTKGASQDTSTEMAAEAYLSRLGERGIEYVFANAGTDFAPIVEALARPAGGRKYPRFITVPHENVAMAMAHGYYRTCGKPAAVMVHVTVGTANAMNGLINAARDNIPLLLAAGRTPLTETGHISSRNRSIHWGQESFDQGGMVREYVKWDYELRGGQPVDAVVDRALDIAMTEPRGPVYLTLPREVLTDSAVAPRRDTVRPLGSLAPEPAWAAVEEAANLIAKAEFPLIITSCIGRDPAAIDELAALAEEFALPVVQSEARDFNLSVNHSMHVGFEPATLLAKADVVIVLESIVPWIPGAHGPRRDAKIIHIAGDPLASRFPFREMEADLLVAGDPRAALAMLRECLGAALKNAKNGSADGRRKAVATAREEMAARRKKLIETVRDQTPVHPAWLAHCLNQVKSQDAIVVSELGVPVSGLDLTQPRSFMGSLLVRRAGLRHGGGARRQAGGAPARGDRHGRGRLLHVRQSDPLSLCGPRREPADADHRGQQPHVGRGAPSHPRRLPGRRGRQGQRDAHHPAQSIARFREGDRHLRRPRRARRCARRSAAGPGAQLRGAA